MKKEKSFEEVLKELLDTYGPYQVAEKCADWCKEHREGVKDRDWRAEYELLSQEFIRIHNRNWNSEKEEK